MTWVRLDDGFFLHPKARAVGKDGRELFLSSICWSAANNQDGKVPKPSVAIIAAAAEVRTAVSVRLLEAGFWTDEGDHYLIHDFLEYNRSKEQWEAERLANAERQKRAREAKKVKASRTQSRRDKPVSHAAVTDVSQESHALNDPFSDTANAVSAPNGAVSQRDEKPERRVARLHWESMDPKPVLSGGFAALMGLCKSCLQAGHSEPDVLAALARTRAYTLNAIQFELKPAAPKANGSQASIAAIGRALVPGQAS